MFYGLDILAHLSRRQILGSDHLILMGVGGRRLEDVLWPGYFSSPEPKAKPVDYL